MMITDKLSKYIVVIEIYVKMLLANYLEFLMTQ